MRHAFSGAGPGVQTRDGCSVELYRELPYLGELDEILDELPPGATVLELGCGTGRLTRPLLARGLRVTAVDNSPEMLASVPQEATRVLGDIEQLRLAGRFDVALLASCLVNHPDRAVRAAFLAAARRHVGPRGRLFVQRHDPQWLRGAAAGDVHGQGESTITVEAVARSGDLVSMTIRYDRPNGTWRHSFEVEILEEAAVEAAIRDAGFGAVTWHGRGRRWLSAEARAFGELPQST